MSSQQPTLPVRIATAEACAAAIARIGAIDADLAEHQTTLDRTIAAAKKSAEDAAAPLNAERDQLTAGIEAWVTKRRAILTDNGKRKFVEFPTGKAGWRLGRAKLEISGDVDKMIAGFQGTKLARFLKTTVALNQRALLDDPDAVKGIRGLKIVPAEESFYVTPVALELAGGPAAAGRAG